MPNVRSERAGAVVTVILDRPSRRNAVDRQTADELVTAFLAFEHDPTASVAVLWGSGNDFCAGADLKALADDRGNQFVPLPKHLDRLAGDGPMGPTRMRLSKPVIAAIAGHAVAGGLELACWCDLRIAEEDATFGVYCRRWGVPLIDGGTVRLPRLIGQSRALDMILTGRPVGANEALSIGLANRVVMKGQSRAEAEALAAQIASFPQGCMRGDRASACEQWGLDFSSAMHNEFAHGIRTLESGTSKEGAAQFAAGKGRGGRFFE